MASRIQIPLVVQSTVVVEGNKAETYNISVPVEEADVEIKRRDAFEVEVYESEGGAKISNKLKTDANGQIKAWVPEGPYLITAKGGKVGGGLEEIALTEYTFDALTGRGVEALRESGEVVTKADLLAVVQNALVPIGVVIPYGGEAAAPPEGFFTCDGSAKEKAAYPLLYGKIKAKYGPETESTFTIPKGEIENDESQSFVLIIKHD